MNGLQWKQGLSADVGVSHSFYWPPKPCISSEALDEMVHKYLTVVKNKQKKCSTGPKLKPDVRSRSQKLNIISKDLTETLTNCVI